MNVYRHLGDRIGTLEARELAERLVAWHDAMVRHLRAARSRAPGCDDECPHADAHGLWSAACEVFGEGARGLSFLRSYGQPRAASVAHYREPVPELRA
jgi:hypothetical protein